MHTTRAAAAGLLVCGTLLAQSKTLTQGPRRMEIVVERRVANAWKRVDPGLIFDQNDQVRFRFRTNFDGYLYVTNYATSGKYEQLFPRQETGQENRIAAAREYVIPATHTAFRIAGPPGHEIVYWLVSPAPVQPSVPVAPRPQTLMPRCDDAIFRARGECVDGTAGARSIPGQTSRELLFLRQEDTSVVSSPAPLTGPVIYEFRLSHR